MLLMEMYKEYFIVKDTKALLPEFYQGYRYTKVLENTETFVVKQAPEEIIKESIIRYGSEYIGANKSSQYYLGNSYTLPLQISGVHQIYMFPTASKKDANCIWVSFNHICGIDPLDESHSLLFFTDYICVKLILKHSILLKRYNKCQKLKYEIENFNHYKNDKQIMIKRILMQNHNELNYDWKED